jgi:hypothetical protein
MTVASGGTCSATRAGGRVAGVEAWAGKDFVCPLAADVVDCARQVELASARINKARIMRGAVLGFKFVAEIGSIVAQLLMSSVSKLRNFQLTIMRLKMSRAMNPARHIEQLEKAQFVRRNKFWCLTSFQQVGLAFPWD